MTHSSPQVSQSNTWKTPKNFLLLITIVVPIAFSSWQALLNNFVIEKANFDGSDIGLLQSVREIPGFLAFTAVFVLLFLREQRFVVISLIMLAAGTAITGFFPSVSGLLCTTLLMSVGFHYFETLKQSLSLQSDLRKTYLISHRLPLLLSGQCGRPFSDKLITQLC